MWENTEDYISTKEYKRIQGSWIRHYKEKLKSKSWWSHSTSTKNRLIEEYYREGRMLGRLHLMDFKQFKEIMNQGEYYYYYGTKNWKRDRIRDHYKYNKNNGKKFQKANFKKKAPISEHEQAKREWREFKQVRKDKGKTYYFSKWRQAYKLEAENSHRTWQRDKLKKGHEEFIYNKHNFANLWYYD